MGDILGIWLLYFLAALMPGPSTFLVLHRGRHAERARVAAFGISASTLSWVAVALFGYCEVLNAHPTFSNILRAVGSAYFLIFAVQLLRRSIKSFRTNSSLCVGAFTQNCASEPEAPLSPKKRAFGLLEGWVTGMTNPNSALFFLTLLGPIICAGPIDWRQPICGAGVFLISLGWYQFLAWGVSSPSFQGALLRLEKYLQPVLSVICFTFAIRLWI